MAFVFQQRYEPRRRGADAGVLADVVGEGSAAVCRVGGGATGPRWDRVRGRGPGLFDPDHRAGNGRTRPIAGRPCRRAGAASGRRSKKRVESEPQLERNLKSVLEVRTAGDPDEPDVLWTDLSPRQIAEAVGDLGTPVSPPVVQDWMEEQKLALHKIEKVLEGGQSPDRDAQFQRIAELKAEILRRGKPRVLHRHQGQGTSGATLSQGPGVDAAGVPGVRPRLPQLGHRRGHPPRHLRLARNCGHINIGLSHDTSEFACDSFRWYWNRIGRRCYPHATSILLLCDCGGSNAAAQYLFKQDLQALVNDLGIEIRVAHYPSYCSKFNPIERRLFPHVARACQGMLFDTVDTVVRLMRKASTPTGLTDHGQRHPPRLSNRPQGRRRLQSTHDYPLRQVAAQMELRRQSTIIQTVINSAVRSHIRRSSEVTHGMKARR